MDFHKKANSEFFNDQLLFKTVGIIFLVVICVLAIADFKIYQKKRELTSQINAYQKQIEDIKNSSQTLKDEIANTDNKDYLEKLGYEQFNQTRAGETEYMFIKSLNKIESTTTSTNSWNIKLWWGSVINWFSWLKSKF